MDSHHRAEGWQLQFLLLAVIWGSSFLYIKVLDRHWPAVWVAFGRVALGAVTLVVIVRLTRERLSADRRLWGHCAVVALISNAVPFTLFAYGEKHTSSIVAGLWNATTPLWVLLLALIAFTEERPTRSRMAGLLVGFAGVALLIGPWRGLGGGALTGQLACATAAALYGLTFLYTRRYLASRAETGPTLAAVQLICATMMLALVLPFSRGPGSLGLDGIGSLLGLGVLSSGVAFALNYAVIRARGASVASTVTYLIPVVATILGVAVLGEPLHWNQPLGTALLLAGIAVSQGRLRGGSVAHLVRELRPGEVR